MAGTLAVGDHCRIEGVKPREFAGIALLYTALTIILTYPVIIRFSTDFMGVEGDGAQNVWNIWWLKTALTELHTNPYYTGYLHYPHGHTLLFQTFNPFNGLISIPLQFFFKMEVVYNLLVFFSFISSGVGMYLLARYLTGCRPAAFIAGVVFTFCPYHFAHGLGHLQLIAMEWLPLFLFFLFKTFHEKKRSNIVGASVCLVLTALCDWYYVFYAFIFTAIFVVGRFVFQRESLFDNGSLKRMIAIFLLFFILIGPLLGPMIYTKLTQKVTGQHDPEEYSADLTSFFVPSEISTWGRMWFENIWSQWTGNTADSTNFIGYTVLILAIYSVLRIPISRFWGATGLIAAIMALGPHLHILGKHTAIVLPYRLAHKWVPFLSLSGCPSRFDAMVMTCAAVLAAYAVSDLIRRNSGNHSPEGRKILFISILSALICLEFLALPYPTNKRPVPQFYYQMAKDREPYAVIDFPVTSRTLYYATIHKKPIVGGYVSRPSVNALEFLKGTPVVSTLIFDKAIPPQYANEDGLNILEELNVRYVVAQNDRHRELLEKIFRLRQVYAGDGIRVYDCRQKPPTDNSRLPASGETWGRLRPRVELLHELTPQIIGESASLARAGNEWSRLRLLTDFSESNYLALYPDVADAVRKRVVASGYEHYVTSGKKEGREIPCFSEAEYLSHYPEVADAVKRGIFKNGYEHFLLFGRTEGRQAFPLKYFVESDYLRLYPDVRESVENGEFSSGYEHYLSVGQSQGRKASLQSGAFVEILLDRAKDFKAAEFLVFELKLANRLEQDAPRLEIRWVTKSGDFSVPVCFFVNSGIQVIPLLNQSKWYAADRIRLDITGLNPGESLYIGKMQFFKSKEAQTVPD